MSGAAVFAQLSKGDLVHDRYWPLVGGRIVRKTKSSLRVYFGTGTASPRTTTYDVPHCQFLVKEAR